MRIQGLQGWSLGLALFGTLVVAAAAWLAPETAVDSSSVDSSWLALAQKHIAAREYWASPSGDGLQAPNRGHDLRTWFEPTGVRVHARTAPGSPRLLDLRLAGLGRGDSLEPVAAGTVESHEARVEIRREGLVEWYQNSPQGLEQGFTLATPPAPSIDGALVLELAVAGASASPRGEEIVLTTDAGRELSYAKLAVRDANGAEVAARFAVPASDRIRLVVDDAGSRYPLVIDPLLGLPDAEIESNDAAAFLGMSVAGAGDVNGDTFPDVIVGAPFFDSVEANEGAAFVFLGTPIGIPGGNPASATQLEMNQPSASLGTSVAGAGDVNADGFDDVIVGATSWDGDALNAGAAFVFLGDGGPPGIKDTNTGDLIPYTPIAAIESNQTGSEGGASVAGAGDVNADGFDDVIVGAPSHNLGAASGGAAFVFLGDATTGILDFNIGDTIAFTPAAVLYSNQAGANMGVSVAGAGYVNNDIYADVIVGASLYESSPIEADEGAAFLFLGLGVSPWITTGNQTSADATLEIDQAGANLGVSVAGAGDVNDDGYDDVIVGSTSFDGYGAAFVFLGDGAGILDADLLGDHPLDPLPFTPAAKVGRRQTGGEAGRSVAGAGDVNGDGFDDVIVGAPLFDEPDNAEGAAFVYLGGPGGVPPAYPGLDPWYPPGPVAHLAKLAPDQAGAQMGASVAGAGDLDSDGFDDVIVGAPRYDQGETDEGVAFVFHGTDEISDVDSDGVYDVMDNCSTTYQEEWEFCDTDEDGYGNVCDADFDNDGFVLPFDFELWAYDFAFGGIDLFATGTDMDCDGYVLPNDFTGYWVPQFGGSGVPGPSGLDCAGSVPCP